MKSQSIEKLRVKVASVMDEARNLGNAHGMTPFELVAFNSLMADFQRVLTGLGAFYRDARGKERS